MLEHVKDLSAHSFEELIVSENVCSSQCADFVRKLLAWFGEHISLEARVHVEFDVGRVSFRNLHVHLDVILVVRVLPLVRMEQVLVLLKILDDLAVNSDVLQGAVDDNEHFHVDGPVV